LRHPCTVVVEVNFSSISELASLYEH